MNLICAEHKHELAEYTVIIRYENVNNLKITCNGLNSVQLELSLLSSPL